MPNKPELSTAANHFISAMYHEAIRLGVDANALLVRAGLSTEVIDKPDLRVSSESLAFFQKSIWDAMDDETMGLAEYRIPSGSYFMMGKLTINQPTLKKVLELGARFYNLMVHPNCVELIQQDSSTVLRLNGITTETDPEHLLAEMVLLAWHRFASWIIADSLPLSEIHFNYPMPDYAREYAYLFPGQHVFEANALELVFPTSYLNRQVNQNEASLKSFMARCPLELCLRYKTDYSLKTELRRILAKEMDGQHLSVEECASQLHMTSRTLARKLKDEGTSFSQIKNLVRRDKAVSLLTHTTISIIEVAEKVGFSDPAVFTRAFRSWTGLTPKQYRTKA